MRTSSLNANAAHQPVDVTRQLLDQASLAPDLAQTRYKLGLGSIVERSEAQLQQTQAQISSAQAGYDNRFAFGGVALAHEGNLRPTDPGFDSVASVADQSERVPISR